MFSLQCVASHSGTKMSFLDANMPLYFYPFLQTISELAQFEHFRLVSLGVIGVLVKVLNSR
ncbi:putative transcription regulator Rcd1-like family [Medicago truncatula]|uniref:Putative transcription regulator Rcd1-like family n=1 Tax=Medicago truncatula TaxID=3880 RepID=A0A396HZ96_MEDTR|nr:putative transcription regulator Rcd1-like family [Medicago truncatula]